MLSHQSTEQKQDLIVHGRIEMGPGPGNTTTTHLNIQMQCSAIEYSDPSWYPWISATAKRSSKEHLVQVDTGKFWFFFIK